MADETKLKIRVSRQWVDLLEKLKDRPTTTLIIGGSDAGKSTLALWLGAKFAEHAPAALVDADVGQSQIGPPASVGWRMAGETDVHFYFVGDITPAGRPASVLGALKRSVDDAHDHGAGHCVVDTTGYVDGFGAQELKTAKVEILAPCDIILIGDSDSIRRLRKGWQNFEQVTMHRLDTSAEVRTRSQEDRRTYRAEAFAEWFNGANLRWIDLNNKSLTAATTSFTPPSDGGLLVAFIDRRRRGICLGLCRSIDVKNRRLLAYAPREAEDAAGICFGSVVLDTDGRQVDRLS